MAGSLSRWEIDRYNRDGYIFPIEVMTPAEVAAARGTLEGFETKQGGPLQRPFLAMAQLYAKFVDDIIRSPRVLDPVESLIGPDILCWEASFLTKEVGAKSFFSWHQDAAYWGLEPYDVLTAWVALSPSTAETGCMRVATGSHIGELSPHHDTFGADNMLSRGQEMLVQVDEAKCVDVALQPGQMSLHHVKIAHASGPNRGMDRRIGLVIRYIPAHVRQTAGAGDTAMLVRGKDRYGHFELQPRPTADFTEEGFAAHKRAIEKRLSIIMRGTKAA